MVNSYSESINPFQNGLRFESWCQNERFWEREIQRKYPLCVIELYVALESEY